MSLPQKHFSIVKPVHHEQTHRAPFYQLETNQNETSVFNSFNETLSVRIIILLDVFLFLTMERRQPLLEEVVRRADNLVRKLRVQNKWEWEYANEKAHGLIEEVFDQLLEFNKKICRLLAPTNLYQWELHAAEKQHVNYHNVLFPRMHNRWMKICFIAVRPLGLLFPYLAS